MNFGTIKTETWAHFSEVAEEYFRYEIVTRWWTLPSMDIEWKTTVIAINRFGEFVPVSEIIQGIVDDVKSCNPHPTTWDGSYARRRIAKEHAQIIDGLIG